MKLDFNIIGVVVAFLIFGAWWMFTSSPDALNQRLVHAIQEKQGAGQLEALLTRCGNPNHIFSASHEPGLEPGLLEKINSAVAGVETARPGFGITLLFMACIQTNDVAIDALLKHGADPNLGESINAPLSFAVQSENLSLVKRLLDHGADPNRKLTEYDATARQLAKDKKIPELIALFKNASPAK